MIFFLALSKRAWTKLYDMKIIFIIFFNRGNLILKFIFWPFIFQIRRCWGLISRKRLIFIWLRLLVLSLISLILIAIISFLSQSIVIITRLPLGQLMSACWTNYVLFLWVLVIRATSKGISTWIRRLARWVFRLSLRMLFWMLLRLFRLLGIFRNSFSIRWGQIRFRIFLRLGINLPLVRSIFFQ